jgi:Tetratricopeptide repeat
LPPEAEAPDPPGYGKLADVFRRNLSSGHEICAAFAVYRDGRKVVDLWGARGNPHQAEELYRRALDIKNQLLGPSHPDVAVSLHNVAMLAVGQGDNDRARELFERAVAILESSLGAKHPKTVTSRIQLAALPPRQPAADEVVVQRDPTTK